VRIAVDLPTNPKLATIDNPAAGWAHVTAICYSGQHFTDGHFPVAVVRRLAGVEADVVDQLFAAGLWHKPGHGCGLCPQPREGEAVVHDYLEHQRSAENARALRESRRRAGRASAAARQSKAGSNTGSTHVGTRVEHPVEQNVNTRATEIEVEEELTTKKTSSSSRRQSPPRPDVEHLCERLREKVAANGARANITEKWRTDARLLLDRDGKPLEQALRLIDWATDHSFWRSNVLSMPTFRKQYDRLLIQARTEHQQQQQPTTLRPSSTDRAVAQAELLKTNPNPALLALGGLTPPSGPDLRMLPGGAA
jgi:hypothetical protein